VPSEPRHLSLEITPDLGEWDEVAAVPHMTDYGTDDAWLMPRWWPRSPVEVPLDSNALVTDRGPALPTGLPVGKGEFPTIRGVRAGHGHTQSSAYHSMATSGEPC
jgi:hypothetical protein